MTSNLSLQFGCVYPAGGPPIEQALVRFCDGQLADISTQSDPQAVDLSSCALIPPLVNAHTHLEFSDRPSPLPASAEFTDWLRQTIRARRSQADAADAIRDGIRQSRAVGVAALGEIATSDESAELLDDSYGGQATVFRELRGLSESRVTAALEDAERFLSATGTVRLALSPHAPYSVHPQLLQESISLARRFDVPVAMHLAESPAERELLETGGGAFRTFLEDLRVWTPGLFGTGYDMQTCLELLAAAPRALIVHANQLRADEIQWLSTRPQMAVVYCPRTHAHFGFDEHPWRQMLEAGVCVALGTDGRGSNPDLSLWAEVLWLRRRYPTVQPSTLLALATSAGARALGLSREQALLAPGSSSATIVRLSSSNGEPYSRLLAADSRPIAALINGSWTVPPDRLV